MSKWSRIETSREIRQWIGLGIKAVATAEMIRVAAGHDPAKDAKSVYDKVSQTSQNLKNKVKCLFNK